jgi:hypothetical protein
VRTTKALGDIRFGVDLDYRDLASLSAGLRTLRIATGDIVD